MENEGLLELIETIVRPFRELIYCVADIGRYRLTDPDRTDREILQSLLSDDRAAHSYIGPRPSPFAAFMDDEAPEPVHGPYVLGKLDPDSFDSSTPKELWAGLGEFVAEWKQPECTLVEVGLVDLLLPMLDESDSVYRLPEQPGKFHRQHAEIETLGSFSEFVVIARASRTVLDVITAQD